MKGDKGKGKRGCLEKVRGREGERDGKREGAGVVLQWADRPIESSSILPVLM